MLTPLKGSTEKAQGDRGIRKQVPEESLPAVQIIEVKTTTITCLSKVYTDKLL